MILWSNPHTRGHIWAILHQVLCNDPRVLNPQTTCLELLGPIMDKLQVENATNGQYEIHNANLEAIGKGNKKTVCQPVWNIIHYSLTLWPNTSLRLNSDGQKSENILQLRRWAPCRLISYQGMIMVILPCVPGTGSSDCVKKKLISTTFQLLPYFNLI